MGRGGTRAGGDKARLELIITSRAPGKVRAEGGVRPLGKRNSERSASRLPARASHDAARSRTHPNADAEVSQRHPKSKKVNSSKLKDSNQKRYTVPIPGVEPGPPG